MIQRRERPTCAWHRAGGRGSAQQRRFAAHVSVGRINVRQSYVREEFGTPKSGKPRLIPLGDDLIEALRFQHHDRGPLMFCDYHGKPLAPSLLMLLAVARKRGNLNRADLWAWPP
jgi:hypothetical protein